METLLIPSDPPLGFGNPPTALQRYERIHSDCTTSKARNWITAKSQTADFSQRHEPVCKILHIARSGLATGSGSAWEEVQAE
jgi:hypothetical protein